MDILVVIEEGSWADPHLAGSLEALGHRVVRFFYGNAVGEFYGRRRTLQREEINKRLYEVARAQSHEGRLDLIFCYVYDDFLLPNTAQALARLDVPMVNLNVDMVNQWYRQIRTARYFTRTLCAQRRNMDALTRYGANVMYFPMAGYPLRPDTAAVHSLEFTPAAPVTFVGTPMRYRSEVLSRLEREGLPIAVYGKFWQAGNEASAERCMEKLLTDLYHYGWARLRCEGPSGLLEPLRQRLVSQRSIPVPRLAPTTLKGFVPEGALAPLFTRSTINLGFTRMVGHDPDRPGINQVKLRDFEVPLAGGFYLVEEAPEYAEMFRPGVEVETWRTPSELSDKLRYYLSHESERAAIAAAGQRRALAEHTWFHRFSRLFDELGI